MSVAAAGIVVVDKPAGWTSHDVVGRIRRIAGTRKVGHAGTLDPLATGVLVVGVNRATRLLGHLSLTDKAYDATVRLGASTRTDDVEGEVMETRDASRVADGELAAAVAKLTGDIEQVPSAVSAVKVAGERSYARVRKGETVDLAPRAVRVDAFEVLGVRREKEVVDVDVSVVCTSGTYVRALARDVGSALGVGGHLTALRRTRVGGFGLADARTLEELEKDLTVLTLEDVVRRSFPVVELDVEQTRAVAFGKPLPDTTLPAASGPVAVVAPEGRFLALYEQVGADAKPVAVFA